MPATLRPSRRARPADRDRHRRADREEGPRARRARHGLHGPRRWLRQPAASVGSLSTASAPAARLRVGPFHARRASACRVKDGSFPANFPGEPWLLDSTCARPRVHGDIVAVLTWGNDALALVLIPATREDAGWFIVEETASYLWNINTVDCDEHAAAPEHANPHAGKRLTGGQRLDAVRQNPPSTEGARPSLASAFTAPLNWPAQRDSNPRPAA